MCPFRRRILGNTPSRPVHRFRPHFPFRSIRHPLHLYAESDRRPTVGSIDGRHLCCCPLPRTRLEVRIGSRSTVRVEAPIPRFPLALPPAAMLSWKDKVAAKLSRLLADSPSSPSSLSADYSPVASSEPEVEVFSQQYVSPKKFSLSSEGLSSPNSTSSVVGANAPNSPANWRRGVNLSSHSSLPRRWKPKSLAQKDRPSDCTEESGTGFESEELPESTKENMDHFPKRHVNVSRVLDETSITHDPGEYVSYLTEKSTFMSADLFELFQSCLPNIVKGCQWVLLYR
ncbi:hypothetical protein B296_00017302 [Ensete ventricosum]|uniref:TLDc domain-containing protein n=1 Tax=Ensete ventricosum TaxID=4639 RepID=A0A426YXK6_ENSVE|nr:hypothetical protein B296_00017302 [Ensete ventricosum]